MGMTKKLMGARKFMFNKKVINENNEFDAIVVGAGVAGLYQLYKLLELKLRVLVLEAGSDVGGTWYCSKIRQQTNFIAMYMMRKLRCWSKKELISKKDRTISIKQ